MKKNKLIPLVTVASLGATALPLVAMVSCGSAEITKIAATTTLGNVLQSGDVITRNNIEVRAYLSDKTTKLVEDWTCDKLSSGSYTVTKEDEQLGVLNLVVNVGKFESIVPFIVSDVVELKASCKLGVGVYSGSEITRDDIDVIGIKKDKTQVEIDDWTCAKLQSGSYTVTKADEEAGQVEFDIHYLNAKNTTLTLNVIKVQRCVFLHNNITLIKTNNAGYNNFSSLKEVYIYAVGGLNPQRVSAGTLNYKYLEGGVESDAIAVKQLEGKEVWVVCINKPDHVFTAGVDRKLQALDPETKEVLAEVPIQVAVENFTASFSTSGCTLNITSKLGYDDSFIVPEYMLNQNDNKYYEVIELAGNAADNIGLNTIVIPKTVETIAANLFNHNSTEVGKALKNIIFMGTSDDWYWINAGSNWQGNLAMGAYCYGDDKYVQFDNRHETDFIKSAEAFDNQHAFVCGTKIGARSTNDYVIQFNIGEILDTATSENYKKFKYIEAINSNWLTAWGSFKLNNVYINGAAIPQIQESESSTKEGYYIKNAGSTGDFIAVISDKVTLTKSDVITIAVSTPSLSNQAITIGLHTNKTWTE